jgi:hypothetical protein
MSHRAGKSPRAFDAPIHMRSKLSVVILSALGMLLGYWLARHEPVTNSQAQAMAGTQAGVVSARSIELVDAKGKRQALMATSAEGAPGIWLFDKNGKARLNMGLYSDNNAVIVLNDENEQAVEIFRTVGPQNAPVLVMKSHGRDRIVMGLNWTGEREPFLVLYDASGTKQTIFGHY